MTANDSNDAALREELMKLTAKLAGMPREKIDDASTLDSLGLDSSDAVILAMQIEDLIDGEVEVGVFLRVDTVGEAVDEIIRLSHEESPAPRE